ncbi:MAG: universal stress protein [Candidatus Odinarchaeota archaeon]
MSKVKKTKVLLPLSTKFNKELLLKAFEILKGLRNPDLTAIHVLELPVTASLDITQHEKKVQEIKNSLEPVVNWIREQSFNIDTKIVVARHISEAIVEEANSGDYDLIVLTKREPPKGLRRIFYKSHSDYVTGKVNCPALILINKKYNSSRLG